MKQKKTQRSRQCIYFFWKLLQVMHTISSSHININPEPMLVRFGTYFWIFNEKMESTTFIVSIGNLQNWNLTFIIWSSHFKDWGDFWTVQWLQANGRRLHSVWFIIPNQSIPFSRSRKLHSEFREVHSNVSIP